MKLAAIRVLAFALCWILPSPASSYQSAESTPGLATTLDWTAQLTPAVAKLCNAIVKKHIGGVAVIGPADQLGRITQLGVELGNALDSSLGKQASGFRVVSREALLERLRSENAGDGSIFFPATMFWLGPRMQVDGYVLAAVRLSKNDAILTIELHSVSQDENSRLFAAQIKLPLAPEQMRAAKELVDPDLAPSDGKAPSTREPMCVQCPRPDLPGGMEPGAHGKLWVLVTVTPDGKAKDVILLRGVHNDMDKSTVQTVRGWRFRPANDSFGHPIERRVIVQVVYERF